ncbi:MAG TPA: type II toxin-antitoxin system PemK/MazF family toxin [Planctomycetota bacterium]|nr:type II toxin-antitoxin system PemK/MazF family toxin [Planctomycetota bacterium]
MGRMKIRSGDVVVVEFPGAVATKRRPAVVISTATYHATRPDLILGLLTSQVQDATRPTDCVLRDWPRRDFVGRRLFEPSS